MYPHEIIAGNSKTTPTSPMKGHRSPQKQQDFMRSSLDRRVEEELGPQKSRFMEKAIPLINCPPSGSEEGSDYES
jgi:hypothetical protein